MNKVARLLLRMPGPTGQPAHDALASLTRAEIVALLLDGWLSGGDGDGGKHRQSSAKTASTILTTIGVHAGVNAADDDADCMAEAAAAKW